MKRIYILVVILVVLIAGGVSYLWNRWMSHEVGHDISSAHADGDRAPSSNRQSDAASSSRQSPPAVPQ